MQTVQTTEPFPGRRILRKMGMLKSQKGILNRYFRESSGWEDHLEQSRNFMLQSAENKIKGTAAILGSGWLLDVSLESLAGKFQQLHLYDIHHPPQIRKKVESIENVKLFQTDLTGGLIEDVYRSVKRYKKTGKKTLINAPANASFHFAHPPDFIASVNIMNQLNILITEYIKTKRMYSDKELLELDRKIQQNHLDLLQEGKSCLITDYEEELYDKRNQLIGSNPLIHVPMPEGRMKRQWQWQFDTRMRYREDAKTYLNVVAIDI
ncbi:MAG TPA: hypothetical protein VJ876_04180 [Bacteroidales bacterium]|nr:hypothetical protein [Bacteroidales bacterium]